MTDKELLELAAKAVGFSDYYVSEWVGGASLMHSPDPKIGPVEWNPLLDDGDALRLAVNLGLFLEIDRPNQRASALPPDDDQEFSRELFGEDPCAAMRRAIVRAAAEIGKAMP